MEWLVRIRHAVGIGGLFGEGIFFHSAADDFFGLDSVQTHFHFVPCVSKAVLSSYPPLAIATVRQLLHMHIMFWK